LLEMPLLDPIPSPVLDADFAALEWEALLALVAGFAASPVGRQAILDLKPSTDEDWITRQHQLTEELRLLLAEQTSIPVGGLFDPRSTPPRRRFRARRWRRTNCRPWRGWPTTWLVASAAAIAPARLVGKLTGLSGLSSH